jgi:hypothetical protein
MNQVFGLETFNTQAPDTVTGLTDDTPPTTQLSVVCLIDMAGTAVRQERLKARSLQVTPNPAFQLGNRLHANCAELFSHKDHN